LFIGFSRIKGNAMGLSISKAKSISGIALISAIVVGCGGGGGGSTPAGGGTPPGGSPPGGGNGTGISEGSLTCAATSGAETLAVPNSTRLVLGSCEQYEASTFPTKASTAFKLPGISSPLLFNATTGYTLKLPVLAGAADVVIPFTNLLTLPGGTVVNSFGNFAGKTYQTILDQTTGGAAYAYDHVNTTTLTGQKYLDLNYSRFGLFSRFGTRTLGYYGGWAQGVQVGDLPAGSVTYTGVVIGVIGPGAGAASVGTAAGFSADATIIVNFANSAAPVTTLSLTNFGYSANGTQISTVPVASGGVVSSSSLDPAGKSLSASFTTNAVGTSNAIAEGRFSGSFHGEVGAGKVASEFVGTLEFRTADGRNAIGAFGVRSGSRTNP
jgi:hypothetical protein